MLKPDVQPGDPIRADEENEARRLLQREVSGPDVSSGTAGWAVRRAAQPLKDTIPVYNVSGELAPEMCAGITEWNEAGGYYELSKPTGTNDPRAKPIVADIAAGKYGFVYMTGLHDCLHVGSRAAFGRRIGSVAGQWEWERAVNAGTMLSEGMVSEVPKICRAGWLSKRAIVTPVVVPMLKLALIDENAPAVVNGETHFATGNGEYDDGVGHVLRRDVIYKFNPAVDDQLYNFIVGVSDATFARSNKALPLGIRWVTMNWKWQFITEDFDLNAQSWNSAAALATWTPTHVDLILLKEATLANDQGAVDVAVQTRWWIHAPAPLGGYMGIGPGWSRPISPWEVHDVPVYGLRLWMEIDPVLAWDHYRENHTRFGTKSGPSPGYNHISSFGLLDHPVFDL